MDFAPAYLIQRFFYRVVDFFHHWYVDGSREIGHRFISTLEKADRAFAVKITIKYFFLPLYGDFSGVGRVVGFIFRTLRIVAGSLVYLVIAILFLIAYLAWLAIPLTILFYGIRYL